VGCGNYTSSTRPAREEFYAGHYTESAKSLEKGAHGEGDNQLLYLMDRATILYHGGDYEESNKDFHQADKLSEIKDYTSLATEAATLVTNEKIIPYKGEDFEKVLISQYLALNYLNLHKYEDALVECRRVNHKLHLMISQGKRKYKLNPMARYLAALIYESQGEWNDAYVDYQGMRELLSQFPYLREDLYRLAWRNRIPDHMEKWASEFQLSQDEKEKIKREANWPEVVVIAEVGFSPEKRPHPAWYAIPKYVPRHNSIETVNVTINGEMKGSTLKLFDVESTAIENLNEKFAGLLAKRIAGVIAKEVIADQVSRRTDPLIGFLLWLGLYSMDQADLRSWLTLPQNFQIFRKRIPPGELVQKIGLELVGSENSKGHFTEKTMQFSNRKPYPVAYLHLHAI